MADAASIIHLSDALWEILLGKVTLWLLSSQYHKSIRIITSQVIDRRDLSFQVKNKKGRKGLVPRCLVIFGWNVLFFTLYNLYDDIYISVHAFNNKSGGRGIIIKKETNTSHPSDCKFSLRAETFENINYISSHVWTIQSIH